MKRLLLHCTIILIAACSGSTNPPDGANADPRCNPIAVGDCAMPFPSSYYLKADTSTATGWRVNIPTGVLPKNPLGVPMDPARLNIADGFSPATTILANLKARVGVMQLPHDNQADYSGSQAPTSTVQLLRYDTGERVPLFAEPDNNALADEDQVLIIRPMIRLQENTRYVVALVNLVDDMGKQIVNQPFEALKAGKLADGSTLAAIKANYDEIFAFLEGHSLPRASLTLAWDFRTGSDAQIRAHLVGMRDTGLKAWDDMKLGYKIDPSDVNTSPGNTNLAMQIVGTFTVPRFLTDDGPYALLQLDANGLPQMNGTTTYPFKMNVPKCALTATAPVPFLLYGHGLFGSSDEINTGWQSEFINTQLCAIDLATNWIGMDEEGATAVAAKVLSNITNFPIVSDRLQQGQLNFLVLAHMARRLLPTEPLLQAGGKPMTDGKQMYYFGCSQGGIEGGTFLALSPDVERAALDVGAGEYALMISRSADFKSFKDIFDALQYPQRDQQFMMTLMQAYWDFADPISYASVLGGQPLPDYQTKMPMSPRRFAYQEGRNDSQVPNVATRMMVRSMGLAHLGPMVEPVFGVTASTAVSLPAAYIQYDVGGAPITPDVNTPLGGDNGVHGAVRKLAATQQQWLKLFTPDGDVFPTCGSTPCVFPMPM